MASLDVSYKLLSLCFVWLVAGSSACSEGTSFFSEVISPKRSSRDLSRSSLLPRTPEGSSRKSNSEGKCWWSLLTSWFTKGSTGVGGWLVSRNSEKSLGSSSMLLISSLLARFTKDSSNPLLRPILTLRRRRPHGPGKILRDRHLL